MKKFISIVLVALMLCFSAHAMEWDYDKGSKVLSAEEEKEWEDAIEAKRRDPEGQKKLPVIRPAVYAERLSFTIDVKGKELASPLSDIAGRGSYITAYVVREWGYNSWTFSLKGEGGTMRMESRLPDALSLEISGSLLKFKTIDIRAFNGEAYYDINDRRELRNELADKNKGDGPANSIYIRGEAVDGKIENLQVWQPYIMNSGVREGLGYGEFITTGKGMQTDVLDCRDVKYEVWRDIDMENDITVYSVFSVSRDKQEYQELMKRQEDIIENYSKYEYDHGPTNNYKDPFKWTEYGGDGVSYVHDAYTDYELSAAMPPIMGSLVPAFKGIGDAKELSVQGIVETINGSYYDVEPILKISGTSGDAYFEVGGIANNSDMWEITPQYAKQMGLKNTMSNNKYKAITFLMCRIKDYKDYIKYLDRTKPQESLEMVMLYKDVEKTEIDALVLRYKTSLDTVEEQVFTVDDGRLTLTGEAKYIGLNRYYESWNFHMVPEEAGVDYLGKYLDWIGVEWR